VQQILTSKKHKLDAGELSASTLGEYRHTTDRIVAQFQKPGKAVLRKHKAASSGNMMEADEPRRPLDAASAPLKSPLKNGCQTNS